MPYYPPPSASGITFAGYTPVLTASTTNPNLGATGSIAGRVAKSGTLVEAHAAFAFGGAGVSDGSGTYLVTLPYPTRAPVNDGTVLGVVWCYDSSATRAYVGLVVAVPGDTSRGRFRVDQATNMVTNASPVTWADGDNFSVWLHYEAES